MRTFALVVLFACSSKTDKPAPATFAKLKLSVDGKPLPIDAAFMRRPSPDVFSIVLGAGKGSCTEDGNLGFTITKRVAASGHEAFWITDLYSRDIDLKLAAPIKVSLDGTKLELPAITEGKLAISGQLDLVDCPAQTPAGTPHPARIPTRQSARPSRRRPGRPDRKKDGAR